MLSVLFSFTFCNSNREKKEVEAAVFSFFESLRSDDLTEITNHYSKFYLFDSYYLSDSIKILNTLKKDSFYIVKVNNYYTNGLGKLNKNEIDLYLSKNESTSNFEIFDSKNIFNHNEKGWRLFALKTGCLTTIDSTDVKLSIGLIKADSLWKYYFIDIVKDMNSEIYIKDFTWEKGYLNSASGRGIVYNKSSLTFDGLDLEITYGSDYKNEIKDEGYILETIKPNESRPFSFYTTYIGDRKTARVRILFNDFIFQHFANKRNWTGNEYEEFKNNPTKRKY